MDWDQAGRGRLLVPPELGPIGPDASQDHGDLAGYGDTRLLRSDAPRQPRSPRLEGRPALAVIVAHDRNEGIRLRGASFGRRKRSAKW
jgi:hypothetical protein